MKNTTLQICSETIHPGEQLSLALPLPELFSCAPLYMPIKVAHGKQAGPCILLTAAMYGDELNGTEIINRIFQSTNISRLRGTLIAVPVLNVSGVMNREHFLPGGIDLNRCFPGSESGTHAARMTHAFISEIYAKADVCIDLHTGCLNYSNLPQVYVNFADENAKQLAKLFNAPVISNIACEKGMYRTVALKDKKPFLTFEAGEALRFDEYAINFGVKGILNVMRHMSMLPTKSKSKKENKSFFSEKSIWVRASTSGMSQSQHSLGQHVKKGETLCTISDIFGASDSTVIKSPDEAIIVGKNNLPLIHEGEALFQLAVFPRMQHAASELEDWEEENIDNVASDEVE